MDEDFKDKLEFVSTNLYTKKNKIFIQVDFQYVQRILNEYSKLNGLILLLKAINSFKTNNSCSSNIVSVKKKKTLMD